VLVDTPIDMYYFVHTATWYKSIVKRSANLDLLGDADEINLELTMAAPRPRYLPILRCNFDNSDYTIVGMLIVYVTSYLIFLKYVL
jgi:hypothetical protein